LFCLEALLELFPERSIHVFAKNDTSVLPSLPARVTHHHFGSLPPRLRTIAFAATGLACALRDRPSFVLTTHPHFMKALRYLGARTPTLASAHGIEVWGHLTGALGVALRHSTGLLPVSRFTAKVLEEEGRIPTNRIQVVPNTFREDLFSPGPKSPALLNRYNLQPEQPLLLTIGRLAASERYKGQDQILLALPQLLQDLPALRYLIGGRGDDEPRLRKLAVDLGVAHAVIFTGFIPEAELADHYRLADLYVMPSTGEGFGIVFLESMACGRPCLAGNRDASPEALDKGRLGLVVNPRDPQAIALAIASFFANRDQKPWLREPLTLHREATRLFGFAQFKQSLKTALDKLLPQ
jgi:glycosyltransferase involved in cell wall biosynthesis